VPLTDTAVRPPLHWQGSRAGVLGELAATLPHTAGPEAAARRAQGLGIRLSRCQEPRSGHSLATLSGLLWPLLAPVGDRRLEALLAEAAVDPRQLVRVPYAVDTALVTLAARQPLLLLVDDWAAADRASRDVLTAAVASAATAPVALLSGTRPAVPPPPGSADRW
jgi:hypothetical protein